MEITSKMYVDNRINCTQLILRLSELNKYRHVLVECKESAKGLDGYQCTLGETTNVTMKQFWCWYKLDSIGGSGDIFTGPER